MILSILGFLYVLVAPGDPTLTKETTTCYSCTFSGQCTSLTCTVENDICLSTVLGDLGGKKPILRNGLCVAPKDCQAGVYTLSYGFQQGLWANVTCCRGNCSEPPAPDSPVSLFKGGLSNYLCPVCSLYETSCDNDSYLLCPQGETSCVSMNWAELGGDRNFTLRGCGSEDLCRLPENHTLILDYRLIGKPICTSSHRAVLEHKSHHSGTTGSEYGTLLLALVGAWMATWLV
ncbi:phospholipase A2 inhibitor and Ly6/PLAUR domain-containing protein [Dromiciops gliroides]|uniref:phospholipase A2 inhibitor and Ly6/PLAUR domain-containing protein n=1 Tax=Dromiciops gliroides TaxID=33562 RepID=UPI001CC4CB7B|nr:phospholipase A2 inhibitor and Ly6/PLAUR domain-containing protein [Dromiciops gliroides]